MWNGIQCYIQGRSHVQTNTPCQDKTYFYNNNDSYIIALADGAGSAKFSHFGAEIITKEICHSISE